MTEENDIHGPLASISMIILSLAWLSIDTNGPLFLKIAITINMVLITSILFAKDSRYSIFSLFIIGICLRFHYVSFVDFAQVPYSDAQIDMFMAGVLQENGQITFIKHEIYDDRLLYYSSWPLSQICVAVIGAMTGLSTLNSTHLMQLFFYVATFFLAYQIIYVLAEKILAGSESNLRWGILLFVVLPELNYWQGEYVRLSLGLLSCYFVIYCMVLMLSQKSRLQSSTILILSCGMLGFSHNLTTAISVISFAIALALLTGISKIDKSINKLTTKSYITTVLNNVLLLSIVGIIWWSLVGEVLFPKIQGVIGRYQLLLVEGFSLTHNPVVAVPAALSPVFSKIFLYGRDFLILFATAAGFLILSKENLGKGDLNFNFYFSFSVSYFLTFLLLFFWAEPFRVLTYASCFMMVSMAKFYSSTKLWKADSGIFSIRSIVLILILAGSFISPHAHTHAPMYFYDDELDQTDFGIPENNAWLATEFVLENANGSLSISSDHPDYSIHSVPLGDIGRFYAIFSDVSQNQDGSISYNASTDIVIFFRGGNLFQMQSAQSTNSTHLQFTEESEIEVLRKLESSANLVYNQGDKVSVWIIPS